MSSTLQSLRYIQCVCITGTETATKKSGGGLKVQLAMCAHAQYSNYRTITLVVRRHL